ncbi:bifunctional diguanylate cyclase/phosphodiesterase [Dactylosporangium vinaceum]|uniref:Bifunctional diguanylate cyclase/phosphodiesterase n=1 Tax=Dactylosporangium vinaceum TaxID=53362 RepID=A0ABV5LZS9_9ACTN|nr:bifunctional diguanylate cyclase/phosphodiesterase [Dactylosporangium vinaceum]UAB94393.1 bifunctional diguanylate cyclase/phosphodiesterase [Dactylosporangium vinaceum]
MAPWRPTRLLIAASVLALLAEGWFAVGLVRPTPAAVSWIAVPCAVGFGIAACLRAAAAPGIAPGAARFWRHVAVAMAFIGLGAVSNGADMARGIARTGHVGSLTAGIYVGGLVVLLWAMFRIPGAPRTRGEWLRFGLDCGTVLVTVATFAWHFLLSDWQSWSGGNVTGVRAIMALLGCLAVCVFAFVKIAFTGTGPLDRRALYLLASAGAVGGLGGALAPLLGPRPYLNGTPILLPITCLVLTFAADRQRRAARVVPATPRQRERPGFVSYAGVLATCLLLLADAWMHGADILGVAIGAVTQVLLVGARQVTALRDNAELVRSLAWQAGHDSLTSLANRRLLTQHITDELGRGERVAVALVDIDDFKAINDDLGHTTGDALLRAVAGRLRELMPGALVARLGGDEYALVFPAADEPAALRVLRTVAAGLRLPVDAAGHALVVEASIGVAVGESELSDADELLRRADVAMYAAKVQGKGRQVAYDSAMDQRGAEQARVAAELRTALDLGQLRVFYQPIVRLDDGGPVGVEALVRWEHPERGMIRPDLFIPAAERTGMIVPVGQWVLTEALRQAAQWRRELGPDALRYVSVNVSPRQLRETGFAATLRDELRTAGLPPSCLMVEVTETAVFDGGSALDELHAVKRLGVQVALDDFGTGHSSLGLLRTCPVDVLKVDKSFVDNVTDAGERSVIAEALIGIADGLRLRAVAEGVETEEQAAALRRLGYQYAQGYYYGRPVPAAELTSLRRAAAPAGRS